MYHIMLFFLLGCCAYDGLQLGQDVWVMWYEKQGNVFLGLSSLTLIMCVLAVSCGFLLGKIAVGKTVTGIVVSAGCGLTSIRYMGAKGGAFDALPDLGSMGWIIFGLVCVCIVCSMVSEVLRERIVVDAMPVAEQAKTIQEGEEKDYEDGRND